MSRVLKFLLCILIVLPLTLLALPSDDDKIMQVSADSTLINYKSGISTYEGNVKINQGTSILLADKLITKSNAQHKMEEAIAYGTQHLAEYITTPKEGEKALHAKARVIHFYPIKSTVILEEEVNVIQGENSFHGPMIIYNMKDQTINAPANKNGRATIIIDPNQLKS